MTYLAENRVCARASLSAAFGVGGSGSKIPFDVIDFDSHGAITSGSGFVFTAPRKGYYQVTLSAYTTAYTYNSGADLIICVFKAASLNSLIYNHGVGVTYTGNRVINVSGSAILQCNAGDTLYIGTYYGGAGWNLAEAYVMFNEV
jgi:hypothetical protein